MGDVINSFMERYNKEFDFYLNLSKLVENNIRGKLHSFGVRAIVSSRAKSPKRLRDKIIDRNSEFSYSSVEEIYKDIVDLAGVRVAIYFPGDMIKVEEIISAEFDMEGEPKTFPEKKKRVRKNNTYEKIFSGYAAKHFRVKIKNGGRYSNYYPVEIQVASVLMHAWSEVEHDLVYKPLQGNLSHEELMILDEINGLVLSGNLALERLQLAGIKRTETDNYEFKNHYDLASFFMTALQYDGIDNVDFNDIFKILKKIDKTKRDELTNVLSWFKLNPINKEATPSKHIFRFVKRDPVSHLYEYIVRAVVNVFPIDTQSIMEKCAEDGYGDYDFSEKAKETLFKSILAYYFKSPELILVDSVALDYDINRTIIYGSNEESLTQTMNLKNISFSKSEGEVIDYLEDYLDARQQLTIENFSVKLINDLIIKNRELANMIVKNPNIS